MHGEMFKRLTVEHTLIRALDLQSVLSSVDQNTLPLLPSSDFLPFPPHHAQFLKSWYEQADGRTDGSI